MQAPGKQRGFLLIVAVVLIAVAAIMAMAMAVLTSGSGQAGAGHLESTRALFVAESGLEKGLFERLQNGWDCSAPYTGTIGTGSAAANFSVTCAYYTAATTLSAGVTDTDSVIPLTDLTGFAPYGRITVELESVNYSGQGTTAAECSPYASPCLTGAERGAAGTTAAAHLGGVAVSQNQYIITSVGTSIMTPASRTVERVLVVSGIQGWAVGKNGTILGYDGSAWSAYASGTTDELQAVTCHAADECWAVGKNNVVAQWDGTSWSTSTVGTDDHNGVACQVGGDYCFLVSKDKKVWQWYRPTDTWSLSATLAEKMKAIHCPSTVCYAVGKNGYVYAYTGGAWGADPDDPVNPPGTSEDLEGVSCPTASVCWAVGKGQKSGPNNWFTFNERDATGWTERLVSASKDIDLKGVSCASTALCWAVGKKDGANYTFAYFDGSVWTPYPLSGGVDLEEVSCPSTSECWAVGKGGRIVEWTGPSTPGTWATVASGTANDLKGVYFFPGGGASSSTSALWREVYQ